MSELDWASLIFGSYTHVQIAEAIAEPGWRSLRMRIIGMPQRFKFEKLKQYVHELDGVRDPALHSLEDWQWRVKRRQICVTNYVNALRRGGLI